MGKIKFKKNLLEKAVFGVSSLFIIALLAYLLYESFMTDHTKLPIIEIYAGPGTEL